MRAIFIGPSGAGKTTLAEALTGGAKNKVFKTQALEFKDLFIDTPGEYIQLPRFHHVLLDTALRAQVVVLVQDATADRIGIPPGFARALNRPVLGVITKLDHPRANPERAAQWLQLAGVVPTNIFGVSAWRGEGLDELAAALAALTGKRPKTAGNWKGL